MAVGAPILVAAVFGMVGAVEEAVFGNGEEVVVGLVAEVVGAIGAAVERIIESGSEKIAQNVIQEILENAAVGIVRGVGVIAGVLVDAARTFPKGDSGLGIDQFG